MLLDQQVPMEWAFMGPFRLQARLNIEWSAEAIAATPLEKLEATFRERPALHRYPANMAKRTQALCEHLVEHYDGDAERVWKSARSADAVINRLKALPGYGEEKSRILLAILAKRFGKTPAGWETAVGNFADGRFRSVADIDGPNALDAVRAYKKELKAKGKPKDG